MRKRILFVAITLVLIFTFAPLKVFAVDLFEIALRSDAGIGSLTGDGLHAAGSTITVIATPSRGFVFVDWRERTAPGAYRIVSTESSYTFTVTRPRELIARFEGEPPPPPPPIFRTSSRTLDGRTIGVLEGFNVGTDRVAQFISMGVFDIPFNVTRHDEFEIRENAFTWMDAHLARIHRDLNFTTLILPYNVTRIGAGAFMHNPSLASITIPPSVTYIGEHAFFLETIVMGRNPDGRETWIESEDRYPPPNLTVRGEVGSYAETWARRHGIPFVATAAQAAAPAAPTEAPNISAASTWAHEGINAAFVAGLVPAALQGAYTQATTRAEFAALAVALYEAVMGAEIAGRVEFADTNDVNVQKMAYLGVVSGVGENNFAPDNPLTREQAATMLARLANVMGSPLSQEAATFADADEIAAWAFDAVGQMQANGIMGGVGDNQFAPRGDYTREQSIITILRLYDTID
ncbi:MAG: S-layer homology domain-containing protein [Clostridiales bacterium]|nr:S-layer homology domain-containing protein [Clostridiales bacterium]